MEIDIREIRMEDAAAAARLSGQLGYPTTAGEMEARIAQLLQSPSDVAWVAALGGGLIGWIQASRMMRLESGLFAEITGLVVDARARGAGVGKQLVAQVQAWALAQSYTRVVVRMNVTRTETHGFYSKLGFVEKKQQVVWDRQLPAL
jgi:GNAT superfamily N-acetyltransferase